MLNFQNQRRNKGFMKSNRLEVGDIVKLTDVWKHDKIFFGKEIKNGLIGEVLKLSDPSEQWTDCYVIFEGRDISILMNADQLTLLWRPLARRDLRWILKHKIIDTIRYW